jgi:hypothetical protein
MGSVDCLASADGVVLLNLADGFSGDRAPHKQRSPPMCLRCETEAGKYLCHLEG